jgi:hypothetical protein
MVLRAAPIFELISNHLDGHARARSFSIRSLVAAEHSAAMLKFHRNYKVSFWLTDFRVQAENAAGLERLPR